MDPALPSPSEILAPKVRNLFFDTNGNWIPSRYKAMHGGRMGLKSWGFARVGIILAAAHRVRFLCCREFQNSIVESVHHTLVTQIEELGLERYFAIRDKSITSYCGSEFIFKGLHGNTRSIKSTEGVDIAWVEEAANVTKDSWRDLTPTVFRNEGAEIWVSFNPDGINDPVSQMFIEQPIPGARIVETNWRDNPWLPQGAAEEREYLAKVDQDAYAHVWEGKYRQNGKAQILAGKTSVEAFTPSKDWDGPYQGADWGFSQDPTTLVRCWIAADKRKLYIEHEAYAIGRDYHKIPELFDSVPDARKPITRGDCSMPGTISYLQQHGYPNMRGAEKWQGSVEDGINFLRQFEQIVIHPRCTHTIDEARLYSFKVDRISGDVLADIVDKHNHCIDAIRYALQPMIRKANDGLLTFMRQQVDAMKERKAADAAGVSR